MAKKKERSKIDPNAWMNTYSDMVTLLMCFFVLLYAASTPNEVKWQYIFQSFTSSGTYINPFVTAEDPNRVPIKDNEGNSLEPAGSDMDENDNQITNSELPSNFNDLAGWVSAAVAASSEFSEDQISVSVSSSGAITIRFKDSVLFAPNSAELTDQGRRAVGMFVPALRSLNEYIANINIGGHTAYVPGPSNVNDWTLSSARACSVLGYMEWRVTVEPSKYKAEGYGPYTPLADNDTEEGRAQNRRVELVIIRNNNNRHSNATIEDILKYDYGIMQTGSGGSGPDNDNNAQQIIANLESKYNTTIDSSGNVLGNESGPEIQGVVTGIPDDIIHPVDEEGNIITDASEIILPPAEESAEE